MRFSINKRLLVASVFLLGGFASFCYADEYELDKEISRISKELSRVEMDRKNAGADREKDRKEFNEYANLITKTTETIRTENDSIKALVRVHQKAVDSLAAEIAALHSSKQEYDLLQENLRKCLIAECDSFAVFANTLPPMVSVNIFSTIQLLKAELIAKNVFGIEGMNRLTQIANDIEDVVSAIQVVQESSPVADIRGAVNRLRIGCVFEGIVDEKGTKATVWNGYDKNGKPLWNIVPDPQECENIQKAIQIREGKSLPDFVTLPFQPSMRDSGGVK